MAGSGIMELVVNALSSDRFLKRATVEGLGFRAVVGRQHIPRPLKYILWSPNTHKSNLHRPQFRP